MFIEPRILMILDGFGTREETQDNAIAAAPMPHLMQLVQHYPHTYLHASGTYVGLLPHMAGNSLAGHTTIGAGYAVPQPVTLLMKSVQDGSLLHHPLLIKRFKEIASTHHRVHLMGLLSDGGSHAHEAIAYELIRSAALHKIRTIVVHPFLDGRDVPPRSAATYLERLETVCAQTGAIIGSLQGRAFAMDRIETKAMCEKSFAVLTTQTTTTTHAWRSLLQAYYQQGITDEFIPPTALQPDAYIRDGDALIFWNTRADRARQLTQLFVTADHPHLAWFITASWYGNDAPQETLVPPQQPYTSLIDALCAHKIRVCCIAESEKAAHITYFLRGHSNKNAYLNQVIIPSFPPQQLHLHPEMRAPEITHAIETMLAHNAAQFYFVNYANADMLGHTGNFKLTVQGLRILDEAINSLYKLCVLKHQGTLYITADHGKAEYMFNPHIGQPYTGHTNFPVLFVEINQKLRNTQKSLPLQGLADIAPYLLTSLHIPLPSQMKR